MVDQLLENFEEISVERPSELIIQQIKDLISTGMLQPGDKLPSERKLAEKLGISRLHVRDAIKKLEFYGVVKVLPQSGTVISGLGIPAINGMLGNILNLDHYSFFSLVETRVLLEVESAKLAAERRTEQDVIELEEALNTYMKKIEEGGAASDEDIMFHLKIAEISKNPVLRSLMLTITPQILMNHGKFNVCLNVSDTTVMEHKMIFQYIKNQNINGVAAVMRQHLSEVLEMSKNLKGPDLEF